MAEIRKHNPQANDIARAVREAMGETIRPITPGAEPSRDDEGFDPFAEESESDQVSRAAAFSFTVADGPVIGTVPTAFLTPTEDD
jgi:hypothetical protein